jgi:alpha/beta superfamily hydrolase
MHSPVPLVLAKMLSEKGGDRVAWARFDFRGVGASEGTYDEGRGEVDDARAVIAHMRRLVPGALVTVCGHSFGSWVGLRASVDGTSPAVPERGRNLDGTSPAVPERGRNVDEGPAVDRVLLVAPSVRFFEFRDEDVRFAGPKTIFVGTEDEFIDVDEARALAGRIGAELRVFDGFDHHFLRSRRTLAEAALPVLVPDVPGM